VVVLEASLARSVTVVDLIRSATDAARAQAAHIPRQPVA
jgi:hypothetical protein